MTHLLRKIALPVVIAVVIVFWIVVGLAWMGGAK
ncbi:MAG: hypothetical protein JWO13_2250 [Acidobacteriales bacterium]|nr:hypothetical protein [Terriglobales bacterium]